MQTEIKTSYENCQVLVYDEDEDIKIIYTKKNGMMIWNKESYVNIDNKNAINIFHAGGPSKINLIGGKLTEFSKEQHYIDSPKVLVGNSASHKDTKCDQLFELLGLMAKMIDAKLPLSTGVAENVVKQYQQLACSSTVFIAD
jgi:RNase P/RNase MRP subunit p29